MISFIFSQTTDRAEIAKKIAALPKENPEKSRIVVITQGDGKVIVAKGNLVIKVLASFKWCYLLII